METVVIDQLGLIAGYSRYADGDPVERAIRAVLNLHSPRPHPQQGQKMFKCRLVIDPARSLYTASDAFVQALANPFREGNADHRDFQRASFRHRIKSGEDHLVGEIARDTEYTRASEREAAIRHPPSWRRLFPRGHRTEIEGRAVLCRIRTPRAN